MIFGFGLLAEAQSNIDLRARDFGCQPFFFIGCLFWMFPLHNNFIQPKQTTTSLEKKGKHTKGIATTLMYVCPFKILPYENSPFFKMKPRRSDRRSASNDRQRRNSHSARRPGAHGAAGNNQSHFI